MCKYIYIMNYETSVRGVWSTPEKLVEDCFTVDEHGMVDYEGNRYTVNEFGKFIVEECRDPYFNVIKAEVDKDDMWIDH